MIKRRPIDITELITVKDKAFKGQGRYKSTLAYFSERWEKRLWHMEHFEKFLEEYHRNGCNICAAAKKLRTTTSQVRAWREQMPWFAAAMDEILDAVFDDAQATVYKKRGKLGTAMWLLTNHEKGARMGFGKRISLEEKREATLTMRMEIEQMKQTYTRDELEQLQRLLSKAPGQLNGGTDDNDDAGTGAGVGERDTGRGKPEPLH